MKEDSRLAVSRFAEDEQRAFRGKVDRSALGRVERDVDERRRPPAFGGRPRREQAGDGGFGHGAMKPKRCDRRKLPRSRGKRDN
jgi:hypothetical protein